MRSSINVAETGATTQFFDIGRFKKPIKFSRYHRRTIIRGKSPVFYVAHMLRLADVIFAALVPKAGSAFNAALLPFRKMGTPTAPPRAERPLGNDTSKSGLAAPPLLFPTTAFTA